MKALSISEFIELRDLLSESKSGMLRMSDACGGQSFTLEGAGEDAPKLIQSFLSGRRLRAVFFEDGSGFRVEEME